MTTKNDVTGDKIQTKSTSQQFRDNYDLIFKKVKKDEKNHTSTKRN